MPYMIMFSDAHPFSYLSGLTLELFKIRQGREGWTRDDERGTHWGYNHPVEGVVRKVSAAGTDQAPKLVSFPFAYEIIEVEVPVEGDLVNGDEEE